MKNFKVQIIPNQIQMTKSKAINKLNIILGISLLLMATALFIYTQNNNLKNKSNNIPKVCFENKCFEVEIADTLEERERGLMNRAKLDLNNGMFFVFEKEGVYNFWMKNVLIPLDMIWIDGNNKVVFINENAEPCKVEPCEVFSSDKKAKYVLEVNGGVSREIELNIGDEVKFNFLTLQTL